MKRLNLIFLCAIISVVSFTGNVHAQTNSLDVTDLKRDGAQLYQTYCASCHGKDLTGGMASNLVDGKWEIASTKTDRQIIIQNGNDTHGMPGFGSVLSFAQIEMVNAFISKPFQTSTKPVTPATKAQHVQKNLLQNTIWLNKLASPWALVFTENGNALMTEKNTGKLRIIVDGKLLTRPVSGTPKVNSKRQGGLLDVAIDPEYAKNKWVYLTYSHPLKRGSGPSMTKVIRGRITDGKWGDEQILFAAKPEHYLKTTHHYGSRITFDESGHMYFSIGDRGKKNMAQDLTRPDGKIHRLMRDGRVPKDNPFVDTPKAYASIYSYGNRNPQGLVFGNGQLWATEHGPKGGDELNLVKKGGNYGWPVISYGRNYSGTELTPYTHMQGMIQPISQWTPSIAVSSLEMITGDMFKKWNGYLLAGALKFKQLRLIKLINGKYMGEQIILKDHGRVRDVTMGPDGAIYVVLNRPGQVIRLTPGSEYGKNSE